MVPFCHVTTRLGDRPGDDLLFDVGGDATPFVCMLGPDGAVLARHRGPHSLAAYERLRGAAERLRAAARRVADAKQALEAAEEARRALEAAEGPDARAAGEERAAAAAAVPEARAAWRQARLDERIAACASGAIPFDELEFALEDLPEPQGSRAAEIAALAATRTIDDLEVSFRRLTRGAPPAMVDALLDEVAALYADGQLPSRPDARARFWTRLAAWAERRGRDDVLRACVAGLAEVPADCRPERELERLRARLAGD